MTEKKTTFSIVDRKNLPVTSALQKSLPMATGDTFKLESAAEEVVIDSKTEKEVPRAVYQVRTLTSRILPIGTLLTVKVKGQENFFKSVPDFNQKLLLGELTQLVVFEDLSLWTFNGSEGLNSSKIVPIQAKISDIVKHG